jgi:2-(1,2-epoxy-1,2-dihydrophenyl)acetyl-CoA isomerase
MTQPAVLFEVQEGVATVTLNEGDRMSPIHEPIVEGLFDACDRVTSDKAVRAVVLTGSGRGFSVGADLTAYAARLDKPDPKQTLGQYVGQLMESANRAIMALRNLPVPVVVAINGAAAGGGAGLGLAGDMVIAARSAYFYLPFFPALGVVPDMGATWVMPRAMGPARAMGLALTGERLSAQQAADWGLIWACVDDAELHEQAQSLARKLAAMPAHSILEARAIFAASERHTFAQQLDLERERQQALIDGASFAEGTRAFIERRKPVFPGR